MPVQTVIKKRRDTAANWTSTNPTLAAGEEGYETDTGLSKTGNGSSTWTVLSYDATAHSKQMVKAGESIAKGQAVYVSGSDGTNMIVSKASNASEATSSKTFGLMNGATSSGALNTVVTEGLLGGLDTSAATAGDPVWLGTSGNLIYGLANKPVAPAHLVFIGIVESAHATTGKIFVKVQNGFEIQELHDVLIDGTPADNEVLAYDSATSLWKNQTAAEAGLAATANPTFTGTVNAADVDLSGSLTANTIEASSATIGDVSHSEIQYLNGVTSGIQGQMDNITTDVSALFGSKADIDSPTFSGTVDFSSVTVTGINASSVATTASDKSANYTLVSTDKNTYIRSTNSAITVTVPDVLQNGESVNVIQAGSGQVTFAGSGVTLNSADGNLKTAKQFAAATVVKLGGAYYLVGNLGA